MKFINGPQKALILSMLFVAAMLLCQCEEETSSTDSTGPCAIQNGGCGSSDFNTCTVNDAGEPICSATELMKTYQSPGVSAYATRGPSWVGFRIFSATRQDASPLAVKVWYPALNPNGRSEDISYAIELKMADIGVAGTATEFNGHALRDAFIDKATGPYPVVILSHGYAMNPEMYSPLAEHYASFGFIVVAPDHSETSWIDSATANIERPQDIIATLDWIEERNAIAGSFFESAQLENTVMIGHSTGGYTTLAVAGARIDFNAFNERCANTPEDDPSIFLCAPFVGQEQLMATQLGLSEAPPDLWPSMRDERITAIIPIAGDAFLFNERGLAEVTIPTMATGGTNDFGTPFELGAQLTFDNVSSSTKMLVGLENAGHMIPTLSCADMPWTAVLPEEYAPVFCGEAWPRAEALETIKHFTTAFLLTVVKDDSDARISLQKANVSVPNVVYDAAI